jgi:hypothetical protein
MDSTSFHATTGHDATYVQQARHADRYFSALRKSRTVLVRAGPHDCPEWRMPDKIARMAEETTGVVLLS